MIYFLLVSSLVQECGEHAHPIIELPQAGTIRLYEMVTLYCSYQRSYYVVDLLVEAPVCSPSICFDALDLIWVEHAFSVSSLALVLLLQEDNM